MTDEEIRDIVKQRVSNPALLDDELLLYVTEAKKDLTQEEYTLEDTYYQQVIDTTLLLLQIDNKFPEITGVNANGVSTSFSQSDVDRFRRRVASRRKAEFLNNYHNGTT